MPGPRDNLEGNNLSRLVTLSQPGHTLASPDTCCPWFLREREPPFHVMGFCPILHNMTFKMQPLVTVYLKRVFLYSVSLIL